MNTYTIRIPKLKLFGYHGCYEKEKKEGQEFEIDVEINFKDENQGCQKLGDTIDYSDLCSIIKTSFNEKRFNLLEALVNHISYSIFKYLEYNDALLGVLFWKIKVRKFNPEGMDVPYVEVEYIDYEPYDKRE